MAVGGKMATFAAVLFVLSVSLPLGSCQESSMRLLDLEGVSYR